LILGAGETQAYRVLAWRDEIDPGAGGPQNPAQKR